ncbi:Trichodiene oxygenase [Cladophialophora carrionii]|uniref:Trichodiene oxygenase n=1 Tax=Cladophialophora carrionii TaxID=86049 RepID=A0A1C1CYW2_9EURO|nr:Trichodiene oxygenase [Cladophialophora carrionii]
MAMTYPDILGAAPLGLVCVLGAVLAVTYLCALVVWRLYLCPQAHIPGPTLAKLTYWYEFYYDVVLGGQYIWKIRALHERYGPILRINPEEVHINDADYYDQVYAGSTHKRNKWTFFTNSSGLPQSAFGTPDHNLHRMRRAALNPYFSKAKVRVLQPRIQSSLDNLMARFREFQQSGEPMTVSLAYAALANDIVMEYAFARSDNRLLAHDFDPSFKEAGEAGARIGHFVKQMPWVLTLMKVLPDSAQLALNPVMASYIKLNKDVIRHVSEIYAHRGDPDSKYNSQTTIFHAIMQGDLPEKEKSPDRLWQDGQVVVIAGTLTTAAALSEITYQLLQQPSELRRLKKELAGAIPDPTAALDTVKLEQLPYLSAVIKEGLRLSSGISTRLQRIATDETLIYTAKTRDNDGKKPNAVEKQYVLRPGIPLSMTGLLIHHSPTYFDDPMTFRPQRWIDDPSLESYLVPFSRGTRACVGLNLAYAELYATVGTVFSQYGSREVRFPQDRGFLELYNTSYKDIEIIGDGVTPLYRPDSKGVRITVHAA